MTRRRLVTLAALVALLAAAVGAWRWRAGRPKAPRYETATVDRGRIVAKVTATGTLSAIVTVQVGSQVSGRVAELHADFNSRVRKGQLIAKIDAQLFQAALEQARANLVAAQGNLAKARAQAVDARRQAERNRSLAAEKLIAQADYDTSQSNADAAEAAVKAAEGTVAQAQAALHQAQVNLAYTSIVSPTNGVVISRSVDVGQTVAASLQAPTLFTIAEDLAKMQVDTSVAEADVGRLRDGMPASFTVDAFPGEVFRGRVRQIRNAATTVQNVVTYDAVVDVDNGELKLRPGMTANVTFVYAEKDDALRVPNAALRYRPSERGGAPRARPGGIGLLPMPPPPPQGGGERRKQDGPPDRKTVWVLRPGGVQAEPVKVRTGITDGSATEILEGELQPGDQVVTDAGGPSSGASASAQGVRRVM